MGSGEGGGESEEGEDQANGVSSANGRGKIGQDLDAANSRSPPLAKSKDEKRRRRQGPRILFFPPSRPKDAS